MSKKNNTTIKVFVTKTQKFRVSIKEKGKPKYEVTVNGNNWSAGFAREYELEIIEKCRLLLNKLQIEFFECVNKT